MLGIITILGSLASFYTGYQRGRNNPVKPSSQSQIVNKSTPTPTPRPTLPPIPTKKTLTGGYQTFQTFNNCGPASLSMTLRYFGVNVSQKELGDALRPYQLSSGDNDDKSVTLQELAKKGEKYNLLSYWRVSGDITLLKNFIAMGVPVIASTWTHPDESIGHFRVIKGYDDERGVIIQDDSLLGHDLEYTYAEFNDVWDKYNFGYLVLVKPEQKQLAENIIGENLDETKAWANALVKSNKDITRDAGDVNAKFNKVIAEYYLGKYEDTVHDFEAIENVLPTRDLWYQIEPILAYQKLGNHVRVFEITDKLIENGNRAFSEVYQIRGEVLEGLGKSAEAEIEFAKVLQYNKFFFKYW